MDKTSGTYPGNSVVITGIGCEVSSDVRNYLAGKERKISDIQLSHDCSPAEFLRKRKTLKFMSKQDRLALAAAGRALACSGAEAESLKLRCGVFMSVGYIPFQREEADQLCAHAQENKRFSMKEFSTKGFDNINPILTFACLPNMPAHHLAANFDLQGEYFITYPGTPQLYLALREAMERLGEGSMGMALLGGVADQNNFLVENHFRKLNPETVTLAADAACFMLLELEEHAVARNKKPLARVCSLDLHYKPGPSMPVEKKPEIEFGPASLPLGLFAFIQNQEHRFEHVCQTKNYLLRSRWELL